MAFSDFPAGLSWSDGSFLDPRAPAGGAGPGRFAQPGRGLGLNLALQELGVHPEAPAHRGGAPAKPRVAPVVHSFGPADQERLHALLEEVSRELAKAPDWKVVRVVRAGKVFWRRAPGATALVDKLGGAGAFEALSEGLGVGAQIYEDARNRKLTAAQRLGRASVAILENLPVVNLYVLWINERYPGLLDRDTRWAFSSEDPVVGGLSDGILWAGQKIFGKQNFDHWCAKPLWLGFL